MGVIYTARDGDCKEGIACRNRSGRLVPAILFEVWHFKLEKKGIFGISAK